MTMLYKKNKKSAFTLIEVLVSVSIFILLILAISRIYVNILRSQESISSESYVQSDLEYFMQVASNNLRLAEMSDGSICSIEAGRFFGIGDGAIYYIKDGACRGFYLEDDAIKIYWHDEYPDQALTSKQTRVLNLVFEIEDDISAGQPIISILVQAEPLDEPENIIYLQNTISLDY